MNCQANNTASNGTKNCREKNWLSRKFFCLLSVALH